MTIYSQHPSRGKVQILATYESVDGLVSSTVTSVDSTVDAARIVDALNRVSACATVPVSTDDERLEGYRRYPEDHLDALVDPNKRPMLLQGAHSLWYEHAKALLHEALSDLDDALSAVPAAVRTAVAAELVVEERDLRAALARYSRGVTPGPQVQRVWRSDLPVVLFNGGISELAESAREQMDLTEEDATPDQLVELVDDLRLLLAALKQTSNPRLHMEDWLLSISDDPDVYGERPFYLTICAPSPRKHYRSDHWEVQVGEWTVDGYDEDGEPDSASGSSVLRCQLERRPSLQDLVRLLDQSGGDSCQLAAWAQTPAGEPLAGTPFIVTQRFDE